MTPISFIPSKQNSKHMYVEFLSVLLDRAIWLLFLHVYNWSFPRFGQVYCQWEEPWEERVLVSCTPFRLPLIPESAPDKIVTLPLTPATRSIVLKFNTDSPWSCFSLTPDAGNSCQFTVNSERNAQPNSHPWSLQNGISKHFITSKDGWGRVLAPACLACSPQNKKHFDLYPTWLSLLEAGHVRETGNLRSTFKAMW